MSLIQLINRPCTIIQRTSTGDEDDFDNVGPDETLVDTVWEIQQVRREEPGAQGDLSVTQWLAIFRAGEALKSGDAVLDDELGEFEVIGAPWPARNPRTQQESHVEATVKQTRGPEGS